MEGNISNLTILSILSTQGKFIKGQMDYDSI